MPCSASPTCATSRARVGSGSTSSSPPAMRSASAASRASGCSTQRLQKHDDDEQRGAEGGEAGAQRDRPARGRALAWHPQQARDRRQVDGGLAVAVEPRLGIALLERRGEEDRLGGERLLGRQLGRVLDVGAVELDLGVDDRSGRARPRPRAPPGGVRPPRVRRRCPAAPCAARRRPRRGGGPRAPPASGPPPPTRPGPRSAGTAITRASATPSQTCSDSGRRISRRPAGRSGSRRPTRSRAAAGGEHRPRACRAACARRPTRRCGRPTSPTRARRSARG